MLADEVGRGQIVDLSTLDRGIKIPVKFLQGLEFTKGGAFLAPLELTLGAHIQFVLEDQFQKLLVGELIRGGFLQSHFQGEQQARQTELAGGLGEVVIHSFWFG